MFKATVQTDRDVLKATAETAQQAPQRMRREVGIIARGPIAQKIIVELAREPSRPQYPIRWTSDRQRQAVMATLRQARQIPYLRTHKLAQGWRVVLDNLNGDQGGFISVQNADPAADFVQGERQQGYLSAWPLARLVIRNNEEALQDGLIAAWYRVTGATA